MLYIWTFLLILLFYTTLRGLFQIPRNIVSKSRTICFAGQERKTVPNYGKFLKFREGQRLSVSNSSSFYTVHKLNVSKAYDNCIGFTTDASETVVLECPDTEPGQPLCYVVLTPESTRNPGFTFKVC